MSARPPSPESESAARSEVEGGLGQFYRMNPSKIGWSFNKYRIHRPGHEPGLRLLFSRFRAPALVLMLNSPDLIVH